jgi:hypothetical protein
MGERGDWSREYVLDAAMLARIEGRTYRSALDVGCGEDGSAGYCDNVVGGGYPQSASIRLRR